MALTDFLIGHAPQSYDPAKDPLAKPTAEEVEEAPVHANMCAIRYGQIREGQAETARTLYDLKALIIKGGVAAVVGLAVLVKGSDLAAAFLGAL